MNCPYCAEEIKDEAVACRYCGRDFFVIRPMIDKIVTITKRLESVEAELSALKAAGGGISMAGDGRLTTEMVGAFSAGISPLWSVPATILGLLIAHFLVIVLFDTSLTYLFLASLFLPLIFGLLSRDVSRSLTAEFVTGLVLSLVAVVAMSAVVARIDGVSVLPHDRQELKEFVDWSACICFAFFAGVLIRRLLLSRFGTKPAYSPIADSIVRSVFGSGGGKAEFAKRVKSVEAVLVSVMAIATGAISLASGIAKFWSF